MSDYFLDGSRIIKEERLGQNDAFLYNLYFFPPLALPYIRAPHP